MEKYEYKLLEDVPNSPTTYSMEDINELAKEGWRVVYTILTDWGYEKTLMERKILPNMSARSEVGEVPKKSYGNVNLK